MFEAIIYDERDKASEEPGSSLGHFQTIGEGFREIARYILDHPEMPIYKVEVIPAN